MPQGMIEAGLDKYLLTRFRFKHRIDVAPVADGGDMVLGDTGARVFAEGETDWHVEIATEDAAKREMAETFIGWMKSEPGKAAIEAFAPAGAPIYTTAEAVVEEAAPDSFEGDDAAGADLALLHCGRCHVIDSRNKWGGIGSSPSFTALRGRGNWLELFSAFYLKNPHPSFTQVEGVTEPFARTPAVAPVELTLNELDAILAFVSNLAARDLGAEVEAR